MDTKLIDLITKQCQILEQQTKLLASIESQVVEQSRMLDVLGRITLKDTLAEVDGLIQSRQLSMLETVDLLAKGHSIARFGDGEIRLMLQPEFQLSFQKSNSALAEDLRRLLLSYDSVSNHLLIAFPTVFPQRLWMGIWADSWHLMKPILQASKSLWANTHISRPLFFQWHGLDAVQAWRRVWENKNVCIIAGKGSRFEMLPELFDNIKSCIRIDSEPTNAYIKLDQLKNELEKVKNIDIYLIALGPTGTILASYLASKNYHAIDIGHLASSYLNVFKGGHNPEQLPTVKM